MRLNVFNSVVLAHNNGEIGWSHSHPDCKGCSNQCIGLCNSIISTAQKQLWTTEDWLWCPSVNVHAFATLMACCHL